MITKFIHTDFQIDLSDYTFVQNEENHWFFDTFFTSYTFPFDLVITDDLNQAMGFVLHGDSTLKEHYFTGFCFSDSQMQQAVLEILDIQGHIANAQIRYGLDKLPNWDKKLSELPLDIVDLGPTTIYDYAATVVDQSWPDVNFNFPAVHTDDYDTEDERWNSFEGVINLYRNAAFEENYYDAVEDVNHNVNIMQPMPYFLHVLQKGFEDAGYTLQGDILSDSELQKATMYRKSDYYANTRIESGYLQVRSDEYSETFNVVSFSLPIQMGRYSNNYTFTQNGRYKITGIVYIRRLNTYALTRINLNGNTIWQNNPIYKYGYEEAVKTLNLTIDITDYNSDVLNFFSEQIPYSIAGDITINDAFIFDVNITPMALYDGSGDLIPPLIEVSQINLRECVPDITFGEFIKVIKNWKNLDLTTAGTIAEMNFIEGHMNTSNALDLSGAEVRYPIKKSNRGVSFLLKFKDIDNDQYTFVPVFVNNDGMTNTSFVTDDNTKTIEINALPLPRLFRNNITTAHAIESGTDRVLAVLYDGLDSSDENTTEDPSALLLPTIVENHWQKWFNFRINASGFQWTFKKHFTYIKDLEVKKIIFAYNKHHIIKRLSKSKLNNEIVEVELETESLN